jgi:hypothetical protein
MTRDSKLVKEIEFKFYKNFSDAICDENYWKEFVDVEGAIPPSTVKSKLMKDYFELRIFSRSRDVDKYFENVYLRV